MKELLTLIVLGVGKKKHNLRFFFKSAHVRMITALIKQICLFDTILVITNTLSFNSKFKKIYFFTNKEAKTDA